MRSVPADDRAETDQGVIFTRLCHLGGDERNFKSTRNPRYVDILRLYIVALQGIDGSGQELRGDKLVKTRGYNADSGVL